MNSVQVEQKSFEMPPREGISIAFFLTVADVERSARFYEKVFGARILTMGDGNAPPYLQLANIWMILNVGGGPCGGYPSLLRIVEKPGSRVPHAADPQVRRDPLLRPRSGRLHHRNRPKHHPQIRLALAANLARSTPVLRLVVVDVRFSTGQELAAVLSPANSRPATATDYS
jgi:catechol 2,3-dioxygenase-like lactoylglutathione lyase family enzyme